MNNPQSINMLATASVNEIGAAVAANRNQAQARLSSQQQHQPLNANQRQVALADLFNSLSNLAKSQQQPPPPAPLTSTHNSHLQTPIPPTSIALSNSIQSVMAASMLQQQQEQQQQHLVSRIRPLVNHQSQQQQQQSIQVQAAQRPINSFFQADQINLFSQEVQSTSNQPTLQQQQHHQRINYCTICNKELCNKYFMKTHMLKMHGINLEMEQPEESEGEQGRDGTESEDEDEEEAYGTGDGAEHREQESKGPSNEQSWPPAGKKASATRKLSSASKRSSGSPAKKQSGKGATSVLNGFAGNSMGGVVCDICNKELCSKYFLKVHKQNTHGITDYQDPGQFMYPFAGPIAAPNPFMVPAGIGNTNLVGSPTFPPPNPLSLFANVQQQPQQQQPFAGDCSLVAKRPGAPKKLRLSRSKHQPPQLGVNLQDIEKTVCQQPDDSSATSAHSRQLECFYRLILAQQQLQPQQPQPPPLIPAGPAHQAGLLPMDPASTNPLRALMCFGVMGPAGPMGPTGVSPAMIVDNILRNQHLFNRNSNQSPSKTSVGGCAGGSGKSKDPNNNSGGGNNGEFSAANKKQSNEKRTSKESGSGSASSSRYFSHYTEACPMCDRRFKSIKWLKTHMMNDHKQEIGAYMQMMMQYLYANKSQQIAAATIAAFEQQQQQQQHQNFAQQLATNQSQGLQFHQAINMNKCFEPRPIQASDFDHLNRSGAFNPTAEVRKGPDFCTSSTQLAPDVANDYVIDGRRERPDSLSPSAGIVPSIPSSVSPSTSRLLSFAQDSPRTMCGLNFELREDARKAEPAVHSSSLLRGELADDEDEGADVGDQVDRGDGYSATGDDNSNTDCGQEDEEEESTRSSADRGGQLQAPIEIKTTSG